MGVKLGLLVLPFEDRVLVMIGWCIISQMYELVIKLCFSYYWDDQVQERLDL